MLEEPVSKYCKHCDTTKPLSEFYRNKSRDGKACGWCRTCMKTYQKDWSKRNPDKLQKWREANPPKKKKYSKDEYAKYKTKRYYIKNQLKQWGMTLEDLDRTFEEQGGACAICREKFLGNVGPKVHKDHCHKENRFRGILCNNCNLGLGAFKDNPELLKAAAKYLCS